MGEVLTQAQAARGHGHRAHLQRFGAAGRGDRFDLSSRMRMRVETRASCMRPVARGGVITVRGPTVASSLAHAHYISLGVGASPRPACRPRGRHVHSRKGRSDPETRLWQRLPVP